MPMGGRKMSKRVYDGGDFVAAHRLSLIAAVLGVLITVIVYHVLRGHEAQAALIAFAVTQVLVSLIAVGFIIRGLKRERDQVKGTILHYQNKEKR